MVKGTILQSLLQYTFLLDTLTSFTLILTIWWPPLRFIWIPIYLNCWLAKAQLENMLSDLNRATQKMQSALYQPLIKLSVTMISLIFTGYFLINSFLHRSKQSIIVF